MRNKARGSALRAGHDMSMIIYPELTGCQEGEGSLPSAQIFAVLSNQQIFTVKEVTIDVIDDAGSTS